MRMIATIIAALYYALPGLFANMAPVIFRNRFSWLAKPVDLGKRLGDKPIAGSHKTFRGFVTGIGLAILIAWFQRILFLDGFFLSISFLDYAQVNIILFGSLMGFGALFGDLVKSIIKRRLKKRPGERFFPWDQLDFVIGIIIFSSIIKPMTPGMMAALLIAVPLLTIVVNHTAYLFKIRDEKW